jgi:hypothetical protein
MLEVVQHLGGRFQVCYRLKAYLTAWYGPGEGAYNSGA